ncbi:HTH-type transcriptional activator RhaS [Labrenzia sp. THAF82]|uniref:helix-turn-helix domain-containing protein n=1 Tax=Labrenzia sp. THAF82 TaxID=2587861 RepID=UPI001267A3EB|nr:AraC family transcriptional regulator [Labrenzia sp. THAF82]QFT32214.1 HTH-type transcriptional activator RhaS [Labrenzia sp. THAF82]
MLDFIATGPVGGARTSGLRDILPQADKPLELALARRVVRAFIERFRTQMGEPMTLQDLAEETGCSTFGVIRAFRRLTGVTPMRYLSILRLYEAKKMLLQSDFSVIRICYEVGYESLGSFNNRFKALTGVTPTGLRAIRDTLDPVDLLPKCRRDNAENFQICATVQFKARDYYAKLEDFRLSPTIQPPASGRIMVAFAVPWSSDINALLLPEQVLRTDPIEGLNASKCTHVSQLDLRSSHEFDPPVLPIIAYGRCSQIGPAGHETAGEGASLVQSVRV